MSGSPVSQRIAFYPFGRKPLAEELRLAGSSIPSLGSDPLYQLSYIESYLAKLGCQTVLLEGHYIDRDFMEDVSVFYARNLVAPTNHCRRLHFFNLPPTKVRAEFRRLLNQRSTIKRDEYELRCHMFSREHYQGFCVVRPLRGSPIGRTVLACFPSSTDDGATRQFPCARDYTAHLTGVTLTVRGLAFQQQDVGVSACATTALWSALSKVRDLEDIGNATPAQITMMASRNNLPYGRAMPSEGLSVDQMCQAVQAIGVAPELFRAFTEASRTSTIVSLVRGYIHAATVSEISPVLILQRRGESHAVTVVGMRSRNATGSMAARTHDAADDVEALYVHDDRVGPAVRAEHRSSQETSILEAQGLPRDGEAKSL